jgi:hypothetical protein
MFSLSDSGFVLYYGQAEGVEADKKKAAEIFIIKY